MFLDKRLSNVLRVLSIDSVQNANSGHPGAPMGMADVAEVLWRKFLKHNPKNPNWYNRDRFILSNGHSSILLYSLLHLTGYQINIEDLKNFRNFLSKTPGHPEINKKLGIEITTGPLGQGLASGVGMAIAEKTMASMFNKDDFLIVDHYTWVFAGDGCLMEGISHESCSLAGTLKLGKLIVFYDSNGISIDGEISDWFTDDTVKRYQSYNWQVLIVNGHNSKEIFMAIKQAQKNMLQPSLIVCKTIIGFGSPNKSNKSIAHGAPLGDEESLLTKKNLQWNYPPFFIPKDIYDSWNAIETGKKIEKEWNQLFLNYSKKYPNFSEEFNRRMLGLLPINFNEKLKVFIHKISLQKKSFSTRQASNNSLEFLGANLPELIGGSADLSPSNLTLWSGSIPISENSSGNYIYYGVREFGMTAIANGIFHHGGFIPYTATFLVFSDYARSAIRMSALMKTKQVFIYTHDSIGVGEDGPTHQPIEHITSLRSIPNLSVWRPCDYTETMVSWFQALNRKNGPTAIILSRQNVPQFSRSNYQVDNIFKGGYVLKDYGKDINLIIIATGSEVQLALGVSEILSKTLNGIRVVSMTSTDCFDKQDDLYKESVLPKNITKRVSIEAGITFFWFKYIGNNGLAIGIDSFGESGSGDRIFDFFGFSIKKILSKINIWIKNKS